MDKIFIRDLEVSTIIGTLPHERNLIRTLLLNVELSVDVTTASETDDLYTSVDYQALAGDLLELGRSSQFLLIERFAGEAVKICLQNPLVQQVKLTVDKPKALAESRSVAVEMTRSR